MTPAARGRVLKLDDLVEMDDVTPWQAAATAPGQDAEVEVIREDGQVRAITIRCACGQRHELELVDADEPQT